jgi:hypothetical protein
VQFGADFCFTNVRFSEQKRRKWTTCLSDDKCQVAAHILGSEQLSTVLQERQTRVHRLYASIADVSMSARQGHGLGRGGGFFGQKSPFYPVLVQNIFSPLRGENVFFWRRSIVSSVNLAFLTTRGFKPPTPPSSCLMSALLNPNVACSAPGPDHECGGLWGLMY